MAQRIAAAALLLTAVALVACTRGPAGAKWAEDICAGTTAVGCVESVESAVRQGWQMFAICEYAKPDGAVVKIATEAQAENECAMYGTHTSSKVFKVINAHEDLPPGVLPSHSAP